MNAKSFVAWLGQKTTIAGIVGIVGAVSAALGHQMTWAAVTPIILGAIAAMALPETAAVTTVTGAAPTVTASQATVTPATDTVTTIKTK